MYRDVSYFIKVFFLWSLVIYPLVFFLVNVCCTHAPYFSYLNTTSVLHTFFYFILVISILSFFK